MKSYQDHIKTLTGQKPTNVCQRASAIFPFFYQPEVQTKLLFLNYWKLKRNIEHLLCRLFLRDLHGNLILKKCFFVEEVKAYEIDLFKYLGIHYPVTGSLEVQFSSPDNLVFPYPGATILYQGKNFSTFVHAAQRVLNEEEESSKNQVIESGFNIYATKDKVPFFTFINGPKNLENQKIKLLAYNHLGKTIRHQIALSSKPYQSHYIYLNQWDALKKHLDNKPGCLKIHLFDSSTFPRLIAGNKDLKDKSMSITHTYYDLSKSTQETDYWECQDTQWQPLALMLPLLWDEKLYTKVYFYPIYSPCSFWIDLEIYSHKGALLHTQEKVLEISPQSSFKILDLKAHVEKLKEKNLSLKMIARSKEKIPTRIKIGLDIGFKGKGFPCNICTNFYPANKSLEKKKTAFRWAPIMPHKQKGMIYCHNDAPKNNYSQKATLNYTFYRKRDEKTLSFKKVIEPRGTFVIEHNEKTKAFFQDEIGWCVIQSDNPFITTYTLSFCDQKMVGGDHGF